MKRLLIIPALMSAFSLFAQDPAEEEQIAAKAAEVREKIEKVEKLVSLGEKAVETGAVVVNCLDTLREGIPLPSRFTRGDGEIFNPFTDICWSCIFPIHAPGLHSGDEKDGEKPPAICKTCDLDPLPGTRVDFWEPSALVEVTQTPWKFPSLNLTQKKPGKNVQFQGSIIVREEGRSSFYHVHYIPLPLFQLLGFIPGLGGMQNDTQWQRYVPWLSELDPSWRHPALAAIFTPISLKKQNLSDCLEDCKKANAGKPSDELKHWFCAGCLGSYYPLSGYVAHHVGGLQASSLIVHRILGREHFMLNFFGVPLGYADIHSVKQDRKRREFPRNFYKMHLVYPRLPKDKAGCRPLGQDPALWGAKIHSDDRDFSYFVWSKRQLCIGFTDVLKGFLGSGLTKLADLSDLIHEKTDKIPEKFKMLIDGGDPEKQKEEQKKVMEQGRTDL